MACLAEARRHSPSTLSRPSRHRRLQKRVGLPCQRDPVIPICNWKFGCPSSVNLIAGAEIEGLPRRQAPHLALRVQVHQGPVAEFEGLPRRQPPHLALQVQMHQ